MRTDRESPEIPIGDQIPRIESPDKNKQPQTPEKKPFVPERIAPGRNFNTSVSELSSRFWLLSQRRLIKDL